MAKVINSIRLLNLPLRAFVKLDNLVAAILNPLPCKIKQAN